jgi:septum formation protein
MLNVAPAQNKGHPNLPQERADQLLLWGETIPSSRVGVRAQRTTAATIRAFDRDTEDEVALVLASSSISKCSILRSLGVDFYIDPADIDERQFDALPIHARVAALAQRKAETVALRHPDRLIIAADTLVCDSFGVIAKPRDENEAVKMLARLSGQTHRVVTGLHLIEARTQRACGTVAQTDVTFRSLSPETIQRYVQTKEPLGKAGGYALQGIGALLVHRIEGEFSNVLGLPVSAFVNALDTLGYRLL